VCGKSFASLPYARDKALPPTGPHFSGRRAERVFWTVAGPHHDITTAHSVSIVTITRLSSSGERPPWKLPNCRTLQGSLPVYYGSNSQNARCRPLLDPPAPHWLQIPYGWTFRRDLLLRKGHVPETFYFGVISIVSCTPNTMLSLTDSDLAEECQHRWSYRVIHRRRHPMDQNCKRDL
jgi:hypothetical protein